MKRKGQASKPVRNPLPVRIWTFGVLPPTTNAELVEAQFLLAHRYRNKLVEIERRRRTSYREIIAQGSSVASRAESVKALEEELAAVRATIQTAHKTARRRVDVSPTAKHAKAILVRLKAARAVLKDAKAAARLDPILDAKIVALDAGVVSDLKAARAECGLAWGTYLLVEQAADRQRKGKMDPRFRRYDGSGRIGVQIQSTKPLRDLTADTRLQIDPVPPETWTTTRHRRTILSRTKARIRIGTDEKRKPVWAEFPMTMHRRLPLDADICWAWIVRKRIGVRFRLELQLTMKSTEFLSPTCTGSGVVAVNLGWRTFRADGLRAAYWVDDAGRSGEIRLPAEIPGTLRHADSLIAIQDGAFNEAKSALLAWLNTSTIALPAWLGEALNNLAQWRSCARLAAVVWRWRSERFIGDETIFAQLDTWRAQDRHLYRWSSDETVRILNRRTEFYRTAALKLLTGYATVLMDNTDMRQLAQREPPEGEADLLPRARQNRFAAAPGELRNTMKLACAKLGGEVVPTKPDTMSCHACGVVEQWDRIAQLEHTCGGCGERWDQDANACLNMLARYRSSSPVTNAAGEALEGHIFNDDADLRDAVSLEMNRP